VITNINSL